MRRSKHNEQSEGAPEWLTTYSDLVTLLLTFFVMLFSMAVVDQGKFEEVASSLRSSLTYQVGGGGELFAHNKGDDIAAIIEGSPEQQLEAVKSNVEEAVENLGLNDFVKVVDEKNVLILRLDSIILFGSGEAEVKEDGKPILLKLGSIFKDVKKEIEIQGHTDDIPINTYLYPTNWELSTKRATNVVLFLIDKCGLDPSVLKASGKGEFQPIMPNDTEKNREKNRRIDIVIEK